MCPVKGLRLYLAVLRGEGIIVGRKGGIYTWSNCRVVFLQVRRTTLLERWLRGLEG